MSTWYQNGKQAEKDVFIHQRGWLGRRAHGLKAQETAGEEMPEELMGVGRRRVEAEENHAHSAEGKKIAGKGAEQLGAGAEAEDRAGWELEGEEEGGQTGHMAWASDPMGPGLLKSNIRFLFVSFLGLHPEMLRVLLLALCSGLTPGRTLGTILLGTKQGWPHARLPTRCTLSLVHSADSIAFFQLLYLISLHWGRQLSTLRTDSHTGGLGSTYSTVSSAGTSRRDA